MEPGHKKTKNMKCNQVKRNSIQQKQDVTHQNEAWHRIKALKDASAALQT